MQRSALCRSRQGLSNEYFLANIGDGLAAHEPFEVWRENSVQYSRHSLYTRREGDSEHAERPGEERTTYESDEEWDSTTEWNVHAETVARDDGMLRKAQGVEQHQGEEESYVSRGRHLTKQPAATERLDAGKREAETAEQARNSSDSFRSGSDGPRTLAERERVLQAALEMPVPPNSHARDVGATVDRPSLQRVERKQVRTGADAPVNVRPPPQRDELAPIDTEALSDLRRVFAYNRNDMSLRCRFCRSGKRNNLDFVWTDRTYPFEMRFGGCLYVPKPLQDATTRRRMPFAQKVEAFRAMVDAMQEHVEGATHRSSVENKYQANLGAESATLRDMADLLRDSDS